MAQVSRSGYYKWLRRSPEKSRKQQEDEQILDWLKEGYHAVKGVYGYPRMTAWLRRQYACKVNHKRVYRLLKQAGLQSRIRRKKRFFKPVCEGNKAENTLNREFTAERPNQKWVTDITYLPYRGTFLYLSAIKDLYSKEIVAYQISHRNDLDLVLNTLEQAIKKERVTGTLIHSDQGFQYTSHKYKNVLQEYKMIRSMSRRGNCLDNACMENFFGHLKAECLHIQKFRSVEDLTQAIHSYIHFYNQERIQLNLNNKSPIEYRTQAA
ncbi:integrase [Paenibacillus polymyxa E681]|nr:integrase [Paenibacillus polymyxa E681]ADM69319.1 integrase [Paenibacillus polymyxa E681]ADM70302.2 integrase [Paenibacillus polymyxa E681]ADM70784.2 integrase [Paenibacillus polymyxa E681]ADM70984.2 integrase [Paenibacillus polymyxa E681]